MRYVDFASKFVVEPFADLVKYPRDLFPYQYKRDNDLDKNFDEWAPVLMSMLVDIAFVKQGTVTDCAEVLATSDKYRNNQDYFAGFAKEKIRSAPGAILMQPDLQEEFKKWFTLNHSNKTPRNSEVKEFMSSRYGALQKGGWLNIMLLYDAEPVDEPMDTAAAAADAMDEEN